MCNGRLPGTLALVAVFLGCLLTAPAARADILSLTASVYGSESNLYSFDAPGPGTVWVSVTDLKWPEAFQSLSTSIVSSSSVLGQVEGTGTLDVSVSKAGMLYAAIAGIAGNTLGLDVGVYSLHVGFAPAGTPVPLPETFRLLLVGLGLIGTVRLLWKRPQAGWGVPGSPVRNESVTCAA